MRNSTMMRSIFSVHCPRDWMNYRMVTSMARVSISKAARLVKVSRPTIYKMINSGKLSYTSVVKHGRVLKLLIHQSY